jgi:hypothetical protein
MIHNINKRNVIVAIPAKAVGETGSIYIIKKEFIDENVSIY